jgi:CheY-like chemotaxis protein
VGYIRLIHWKTDEAQERAQRLEAAGYQVVSAPFDRDALRALKDDPPQAVVIDLSGLPSHGRDMALNVRSYKATRHIPLVFVGGQREKVEKLKALLPDAFYTTWQDIAATLKEAMANPPSEPVVPESVMDAYTGTPLPKKLGIKAGSVVSLVNAPNGFQATLGDLPAGVELLWDREPSADLTLWFASSRADLEQRVETMAPLAQQSGLWIIWPKKTSGVASDLSQNVVRDVAVAAGLVDFKVASVDETWSGLRVTHTRGRVK